MGIMPVNLVCSAVRGPESAGTSCGLPRLTDLQAPADKGNIAL